MAFDTKRAIRKPGGDLGNVIRNIRRRMNCGQTGFAQMLCWPQATLSQYESGDARPSVERMISLLRLAATDDERCPILQALEAYGVFTADLAPALLPLYDRLLTAATVSVSPDATQSAMPDAAICSDKGNA